MYDLLTIKEQHRLNKEHGTLQIPQAFLDKFPNMKRDKADKLFARYASVVTDELLKRLAFASTGEINISFQKLFDLCGEFQYAKTRYYVWNAFKDLFPFMIVIQSGSNLTAASNHNNKNTRVKIVNHELLNSMLVERSPEGVYSKLYQPEDEDAVDAVVDIDMENLARFISSCEYELRKAAQDAIRLRAKLQSSIWQAQLVLKIGAATQEKYGAPVLPLIPSKSAFGRTYYKGVNIQNVNKQVRSAIIGAHHQYDMNAAVFGIKLYLYGMANGGDNALVGSKLGSYTRQYMAEKDQIRNRLARHCFRGVDLPWDGKVKAIKDALTALGFGAKLTGRTWMGKNGMEGTAMADILRSPAVRFTFEQDAWVRGFAAEQVTMEAAILAHGETLDGYDDMLKAIRAANGVNGRVTAGGKMAYIYQHYETHIMDLALQALSRAGVEPIARIHDAFIVRDKLSNRVLDDISAAWGLRSYLSLSCDRIGEWTDGAYKQALDEAAAALEQHKSQMATAENLARIHAFNKRAAA